MNKTKTWFRVTTVAFLLSLIIACGQKGDLYLPEGNSATSWVR